MSCKGKLFVISGPSGSGKSTLIRDILKELSNFKKSISVTTRPKRKNETNGKQYFFLSQNEFEDMIANNLLLEWAEYCGYYYGTPRKFVTQKLKEGINIILEIEVKGAMQIIEKFKDACLIFINTASVEELKKRLVKRGTEDTEMIEKRMKITENEIDFQKYYDCIIVNNNYNETLQNLKTVLLTAGRRERN